jgi:ribosomal 50S subunit-associated protein YjgA (DUF615 family)
MTRFLRTAARISLWLVAIGVGLVGLSVLVLAVADQLFDVVHDDIAMAQRMRKGVTENMTIQLAVLIQKQNKDAVQRTIDALSSGEREFLSVGIRRNSGDVYAQTADHDRHWVPLKDGKSSITHVAVPIYAGKHVWGNVEASFRRVPLNLELRDDVATAQRVREAIVAHLAIQLAVLVERGDRDALQRTIDAIGGRDGEILSIGIRRNSREVYLQTADHDRHWVPLKDGKSTITHVAVPIYAGTEIWGDVEVSFRPR